MIPFVHQQYLPSVFTSLTGTGFLIGGKNRKTAAIRPVKLPAGLRHEAGVLRTARCSAGIFLPAISFAHPCIFFR
jgi:hypothetical protein